MPQYEGRGKETRQEQSQEQKERQLDDLFRAYALACPDPEPGIHFMPKLWAGIEAREASRNVFGRMAKTLVTAALATSAILALLVSMNSDRQYSGTFLQALTADHVSQLEPFHLDRISEMEHQ